MLRESEGDYPSSLPVGPAAATAVAAVVPALPPKLLVRSCAPTISPRLTHRRRSQVGADERPVLQERVVGIQVRRQGRSDGGSTTVDDDHAQLFLDEVMRYSGYRDIVDDFVRSDIKAKKQQFSTLRRKKDTPLRSSTRTVRDGRQVWRAALDLWSSQVEGLETREIDALALFLKQREERVRRQRSTTATRNVDAQCNAGTVVRRPRCAGAEGLEAKARCAAGALVDVVR